MMSWSLGVNFVNLWIVSSCVCVNCSIQNDVYEANVLASFVTEEEPPLSEYSFYNWALKIGEERINQLYQGFLKLNVKMSRCPLRCDSSFAPVYIAEEYYSQNLSAIIGPSCSLGLEPVARMAAYWNIPICTPGGFDTRFDDKQFFSTLTRMSFSIEQIGKVLSKVLNRFSWRHISLIVEENQVSQGLSTKDSLSKTLTANIPALRLNTFLLTARNDIQQRNQVMRILKRCRKVSRIVVIVAGMEALKMLLEEAGREDNKEFVYIAMDFVSDETSISSLFLPTENGSLNQEILDSVLVLSIRQPYGKLFKDFQESIYERTFKANQTVNTKDFLLPFTAHAAYNCLITYAWALNRTINTQNAKAFQRNGQTLVKELWNKTFDTNHKAHERFFINAKGDRLANFIIADINIQTYQLNIVATYTGLNDTLEWNKSVDIHWSHGGISPPPDVPRCGFSGTALTCKVEKASLLVVYFIVALLLVILPILILIWMKRYFNSLPLEEDDLTSLWWRVKRGEIIFEEGFPRSFATLPKTDDFVKSTMDNLSGAFRLEASRSRIHSRVPEMTTLTDISVGLYKGTKVTVKRLDLVKLVMTNELLLEMRQLRCINHENLIRFIGLCVDNETKIDVLTEHSPRGCLKDLLQNHEIAIDWPFRFSIIADIIEGLCFLHGSPIEFHGQLKSTNCFIDSRFVVKISDFGLKEINKQIKLEQAGQSLVDPSLLLWTSPEHLREPFSSGSQKGDVYSFSIILQETVTRSAPFESNTKRNPFRLPPSPEEILLRIRVGTMPPFRPEISRDQCPTDLLDLIHQCWEEDPDRRPSFVSIKSIFKRINTACGYDGDNFLENLLLRLEQYTNNLEQMVEQRTNAFLEEKQRSENLLYEILPQAIADRLIKDGGEALQPEQFDCVTICFLDIVGFTSLAAESTPMEVVSLLNDLYTCFDGITSNYDVYKVETIGDAYMMVSGCPVANGSRHAEQIARISLALVEAIDKFEIRHKPNSKIQVRIGVHSGPCAAGVVGLKMPRYCLFGETVTIAMRMESSGGAMKIHISEETKTLLDEYNIFEFEDRGLILIKDLGLSKNTYWLIGSSLEVNQSNSNSFYQSADIFVNQGESKAAEAEKFNAEIPLNFLQ